MIDAVAPGASYEPIISVGDTLDDGYMFESIPDGISLATNGKGTVDLYVNHETSTVPFPYTFSQATGTGAASTTSPTRSSASCGCTRSRAACSAARTRSRRSMNWQRFCSNFIATEEHGFDRPMLLTNEEGIDWVNRTGTAWPATIGAPEARQIGAVVAIDEQTGKIEADLGHGTAQPREQRRDPGLRQAGRALGRRLVRQQPGAVAAVLVHRGGLGRRLERRRATCGRSSRTASTSYYDFTLGSSMSVTGKFVKVPKDIATGPQAERHRPDGGGQGLPARRRTTAPGRRDARTGVADRRPAVGAGALGRHAAAAGLPVHARGGHRLRQAAGMQNVVYVVDSGRGTDERGGTRWHVVERPRLEARARPERPDEGDVASRS